MQQIRPGWTNDELHTATLAREESAQVRDLCCPCRSGSRREPPASDECPSPALSCLPQVISEVRSGRQQHGLPLPWPITETDLEATYLAGLEQDDESEQEKEDGSRPASSAALPGSEGEGDRADGAADASRDGLERAGGRDGEAGSEGHPGDPASASPGKKKPRRRGPQFVCDGGCIAELLRDAIAREHEAVSLNTLKPTHGD